MSVNVRADKKDRKLRSKQRGECCSVFFWVRGDFFLFPVFFNIHTSRCIKTYCTHRIDSEVIADLRFSASKISRLPPKILVPATLVPLPQFRDVICVALLMQRTCNTHATHMQHDMQHDMQHEPFPWKFPGKVPAGMKIYIFHSKTGVELETSNPAR